MRYLVLLAALTFNSYAGFTNINLGTSPNDGTGDSLRVAFSKINSNFWIAADTNYVNSSTNLLATNLRSGLNPTNVDFVTNITTPTWLEGRVFYDAATHTLCYYTDQSAVTVNIGQEQHLRVVNKTGAMITNGNPVTVFGAQGNRSKVVLAQATTNTASAGYEIVGMATQDILDNAEGLITTIGVVNAIDTTPYVAGAVLYCSTNAGVLTTNKYSSDISQIVVGLALNSTVNGSVWVWPKTPVHKDDVTSLLSALTYLTNSYVFSTNYATAATNTLNTTLRSVLQLGSANLTNWSAVAVFSTNGLTGTDGRNVTNLPSGSIDNTSQTNVALYGVTGANWTNSGHISTASLTSTNGLIIYGSGSQASPSLMFTNLGGLYVSASRYLAFSDISMVRWWWDNANANWCLRDTVKLGWSANALGGQNSYLTGEKGNINLVTNLIVQGVTTSTNGFTVGNRSTFNVDGSGNQTNSGHISTATLSSSSLASLNTLRIVGNTIEAGASGTGDIIASSTFRITYTGGVTPQMDDNYYLGSTDRRWKRIHAVGFNVTNGNVLVRGTVTATNGITFAAGSTITNMVSYTSAMDIPSINSGASYTTNISVPNAKANDSVHLGLPDQGANAGLLWTAWPSNGVVWLRAWNASAGAIDPASDTYRVTVTQF